MLTSLADGFLGFCLVAAMVCLVVRYLLPVVFTALVEPLCGVVVMFAALLVLPEYWISTLSRRNGGGPPNLAYLYSGGVCQLARLGHRVVRRVFRSLAWAAHAVPPLVVVLVVVTWQLERILP